MTTTSQTLRAAAEYLREYGWYRGPKTRYVHGESADVIHAIDFSVASSGGTYHHLDADVKALGVFLEPETATPWSVVIDWDCSPNQTAENVIATLEECAKELEK